MIQLLININDESVKVLRCDGLIKEINIPVDQQKLNPKLGMVINTPSLVAAIRAVAEACEEAAERSEILGRMSRLEKMVNKLGQK